MMIPLFFFILKDDFGKVREKRGNFLGSFCRSRVVQVERLGVLDTQSI